MNGFDYIQIAFTLMILVFAAPFIGVYAYRVLEEPGRLIKPQRRFEQILFKLCAVNPERPMTWKEYAAALLAFNFAGLCFVFLLQVMQGALPFNPQGLARRELAFSPQHCD